MLVKDVNRYAVLVAFAAIVGCAGESGRAPEAASSASALENPIAACQAQRANCAASGSAPTDALACDEEMRGCLLTAAETMRSVEQGIAACRGDAEQCAVSGGSDCRAQFEACVRPLLADALGTADGGVAIDDDAGSEPAAEGGGRSDPDAGFPVPPGLPGFPRAGAPGFPPRIDAGAGPVLPGFPPAADGGVQGPRLPGHGLPRPEQNCMTELTRCMTEGGVLDQCADLARTCLRDNGLGGTLP